MIVFLVHIYFQEIPNELESYIKSIQDQSNRFEQELLECDLVLNHPKPSGKQSTVILEYFVHMSLYQYSNWSVEQMLDFSFVFEGGGN